ncbi:MAG: endonuclease/exonuclease/phosphatase family protein [Chlorobi bacterium]|nr:endonuclease/exonuclease/phosphatase family protein [Chlorobiota bacterium]
MASIFDDKPPIVLNELAGLSASLDVEIPSKKPNENLLIATWNIRMFGSLTKEWDSGNKSPKRNFRAVWAISEIISRFDVIAVQEVMGNLRALRNLMQCLGDEWSFLMTDITLGDAGNNERIAYLYHNTRVQTSGLASEIVIPPEEINGKNNGALNRQFARTPYAVSFKAGKETFILLTAHIDYGKKSADRIPELKAIAKWMYDWASRSNRWHHNLLALGDFNIDRKGDELWESFVSTGLTVPDDLQNVPRTIFTSKSSPQKEKFYDQIAWFTNKSGKKKLNMKYMKGGYFDFLPLVFKEKKLSKRSVSFRMSDHFPLWAEFSINN